METAAVVACLRLLQVDGPRCPRMPPTNTSRTRRISISRTEVAEEFFFAIIDRSALCFVPVFLLGLATWLTICAMGARLEHLYIERTYSFHVKVG